MYSPAAIENDPASSPAIPASKVTVRELPEPAKPMARAVLDTNPSLTPNTLARKAPGRSARCQGSCRPICVRGSGLPPWMRWPMILACPRSSAAMPGAASGSASYTLAWEYKTAASRSLASSDRQRRTDSVSLLGLIVSPGSCATPYPAVRRASPVSCLPTRAIYPSLPVRCRGEPRASGR
jgi:hypothetical protein